MLALTELAVHARDLIGSDRRAILGIAGAPGAGKSSLVAGLLSELRELIPVDADDRWVSHVPMDGFHLADVKLDRLGLLHRKGAPQTFDVSGYVNTLRRLRADDPRTVYAPSFDRTIEQPIAGAIAVEPATRLVITEGNYLLHDVGGWAQVRRQLDQTWYVEVDDALRRERLVARHLAYGKSLADARAWVADSDEQNAELVARTRSRADRVVTLS